MKKFTLYVIAFAVITSVAFNFGKSSKAAFVLNEKPTLQTTAIAPGGGGGGD
jgi:hypothetical protein